MSLKVSDIKELWVLEWDTGAVVPPMEENTSGDTEFVGISSREEAEYAALHNLEEWGDGRQSIRPVRVFPSLVYGEWIAKGDGI